jgi:glycosyltransferase involved in cell wall biosynthesis
MPNVSVIIPTYNRSDHLRAAILSVLGQTYQDFEVIVVDDASTDDTADMVRNIRDPRVRYVRHSTNRREAETRNTGVRSAIGEYIAFLDDDDEWLPQKLQREVELLEKSPAEVGGVYTGCLNVDRSSGRVRGRVVPTKRGNILEDMAVKNWVGTPSTVLFRRECFARVGLFDESIAFGVDYDMWIRIAAAYRIEYISEPLVKYYIQGDRLTTNHELVIRGLENQLIKYRGLFCKSREGLSRRYRIIGTLYCYNGDLKKGRRSLLKAIRTNPFELRQYFHLCTSFLGPRNFLRIRSLVVRQ